LSGSNEKLVCKGLCSSC